MSDDARCYSVFLSSHDLVYSQNSSSFPRLILVKTDNPAYTNCWSSRGIQGHWPSSLYMNVSTDAELRPNPWPLPLSEPYLVSVNESHAFEPRVEKGLSAHSALGGLREHLANVGVVTNGFAQVRPPERSEQTKTLIRSCYIYIFGKKKWLFASTATCEREENRFERNNSHQHWCCLFNAALDMVILCEQIRIYIHVHIIHAKFTNSMMRLCLYKIVNLTTCVSPKVNIWLHTTFSTFFQWLTCLWVHPLQSARVVRVGSFRNTALSAISLTYLSLSSSMTKRAVSSLSDSTSSSWTEWTGTCWRSGFSSQ